MRRRGDPINKLGQVEPIIYPVMIVIMNCTVRQLLRKVKSCIFGALAQLGEHYPCKVGVMGSNPIRSTKSLYKG